MKRSKGNGDVLGIDTSLVENAIQCLLLDRGESAQQLESDTLDTEERQCYTRIVNMSSE